MPKAQSNNGDNNADFEYGFKLLREVRIPELDGLVREYRHVKTGAQLISVINDDENKSFDITFRTPPSDSTGVAHILEHSVLCGSRKYPLKEPFVELLKGSLKTFLNAMTSAASTHYPIGSVNERDFHNLVEVYLDCVFFPTLSPQILQQEGWHYEVTSQSDPLVYKGVVFNEMKGAYQMPDTVLYGYAGRSLFPDHTYGVSSGGDPNNIPDLTFEQLSSFHKRYYHPSNSRIWFWGNDDPRERLRLTDSYLSQFEARPVDSQIPLVPGFEAPRYLTQAYAVGADPGKSEPKTMMSMNWVLTDRVDVETDLALEMLGHILVGTPAAFIRKALIDSGLVEQVGGGTRDYRQRAFLMGMKGLHSDGSGAIEELVFDTLRSLVQSGIPADAVEAAVSRTEFGLREMNTGGFPRGLAMAFRVLRTWLYDCDPIAALYYEQPLANIRTSIARGTYFEQMIQSHLIDNPHRTTIVYPPVPGLSERETEEERARLQAVRASMSEFELDRMIEETLALKAKQNTPDSEEALATIPRLTLADLDKEVKRVPNSLLTIADCPVYHCDLFTNGIVYLDLGFDLRSVDQDLLPFIPLFGQALLKLGTEKEDFVALTHRIESKTGGISDGRFVTNKADTQSAVGIFFLRCKSTRVLAPELVEILSDILGGVRLDNRERFRQIVIEEKIRRESSLSDGIGAVANRLASRRSDAGWLGEQMDGITNLEFVRSLAKQVDTDWPVVLASLHRLRGTLLSRQSVVANVTLDSAAFDEFKSQLDRLLASLPTNSAAAPRWSIGALHEPEAFGIPGKVNSVGKSLDLSSTGDINAGAAQVACKFLRTTWLWEKVRVEGGAYGGRCSYDDDIKDFTFLSYRDPNLLRTLESFDDATSHLSRLELSDAELTRTIIGTISDMDPHQLPDSKGLSAMLRSLTDHTDERRQRKRDQVLATTLDDLKSFGATLAEAAKGGEVCVVGASENIEKANAERPSWFRVTQVL